METPQNLEWLNAQPLRAQNGQTLRSRNAVIIEQGEYQYHLAQAKALLAYLKQDLEKYGSHPKATAYGLKVKGKTIEILTNFILSCQVYLSKLLTCPAAPEGPLHLYRYPADQDTKKILGITYFMVEYNKGLGKL